MRMHNKMVKQQQVEYGIRIKRRVVNMQCNYNLNTKVWEPHGKISRIILRII
jgi:hypothetical protein